jgi:hypothetical protein
MLYDKLLYRHGILLWRFETGVSAQKIPYATSTPQRTPATAGALGRHGSRPKSGTPRYLFRMHTAVRRRVSRSRKDLYKRKDGASITSHSFTGIARLIQQTSIIKR